MIIMVFRCSANAPGYVWDYYETTVKIFVHDTNNVFDFLHFKLGNNVVISCGIFGF